MHDVWYIIQGYLGSYPSLEIRRAVMVSSSTTDICPTTIAAS